MSDNPTNADSNKPKSVVFNLKPYTEDDMKPPSPSADASKRSRAESFGMVKSPPRPKSRAKVPNPLRPGDGQELESNPAFSLFKVSAQEAAEAIRQSNAKSREAADAFAEIKEKTQESAILFDGLEGNFQKAANALRLSYPNLEEADGASAPVENVDAAFARFDANLKAIAESRAGWQEGAQVRAAAMEATFSKAVDDARAQLKANIEAHSAAQGKLDDDEEEEEDAQ